jgi:hypothetical protein
MSTKVKKSKIKPLQPKQLGVEYYFATPIYLNELPEHLDAAKEVCEDYVAKALEVKPEVDEIYPVIQTDSFQEDPRIKPLSDYILNTAWDILNGQGYAMTNMRTFYKEFWCQDHQKHSAMEQHAHGYGSQIVGFYFVDIPEDSPRVVFHDPKVAKVQINLPERDMTAATIGSNMINFQPKPGMLIITNAWLAHSFTRSASAAHMRFIHFSIQPFEVAPQVCAPATAEII